MSLPEGPSPTASFFGVRISHAAPELDERLKRVIRAGDIPTRTLMLDRSRRSQESSKAERDRKAWDAIINFIERLKGD